MRCPVCGILLSIVSDSRPKEDSIRRRRICSNGHRFTTYEHVRLDDVISYDI